MRRRDFTTFALFGATTAFATAVAPMQTLGLTAGAKRITPHDSVALIIDVQDVFLSHLDRYRRSKVVWHTKDFAHLVGLFEIPVVVTLEKPVAEKGSVPQEIADELKDSSRTFEKSFFDLTKEPQIRDHIASLRRKQIIVAGCETDVCVLQSCLGLLDLGYDVYMVENLLFSASDAVDAALARMKAAGATFLTYRILFYELAGSVDTEESLESAGPVTKDLPD